MTIMLSSLIGRVLLVRLLIRLLVRYYLGCWRLTDFSIRKCLILWFYEISVWTFSSFWRVRFDSLPVISRYVYGSEHRMDIEDFRPLTILSSIYSSVRYLKFSKFPLLSLRGRPNNDYLSVYRPSTCR